MSEGAGLLATIRAIYNYNYNYNYNYDENTLFQFQFQVPAGRVHYRIGFPA
ncbi:hypothetical protein BDV19DRAFT_384932 [Aspergillus venezuelensis]